MTEDIGRRKFIKTAVDVVGGAIAGLVLNNVWSDFWQSDEERYSTKGIRVFRGDKNPRRLGRTVGYHVDYHVDFDGIEGYDNAWLSFSEESSGNYSGKVTVPLKYLTIVEYLRPEGGRLVEVGSIPLRVLEFSSSSRGDLDEKIRQALQSALKYRDSEYYKDVEKKRSDLKEEYVRWHNSVLGNRPPGSMDVTIVPLD